MNWLRKTASDNERRIRRLEKRIDDLGMNWKVGEWDNNFAQMYSLTPDRYWSVWLISQRLDELYRFLGVKRETTPAMPPVTNLIRTKTKSP